MKGPVLVILPHNPGDVVMALFAIHRLREAYPDLAVDYLAGEESRSLVTDNPLIRRAYILPRGALAELWRRGDATALLGRTEAFLEEVSATPYILSLNLFQEKWGGLLQSFVRADQKIGLELAQGRYFRVASRLLEHLHAIPAARGQNAWHAVDIYIQAALHALAPMLGPPRLGFRDARLGLGYGRLGGNLLPPLPAPQAGVSLPEGDFFVFHPGSAWPGKRWPAAHWAELARTCLAAGITVAFTGAPEERPVADAILASMGNAAGGVRDFVGRTTLPEAAWILNRAGRVVTGDTAAMHLAAACGVPTLALFGPSNPVETGPYGAGHFILQTQIDLPQDLELDREHVGLHALSPETVADFLLRAISPRDCALFETAWDEKMEMQVLLDPQRSLHPCQRNLGLMRALAQEGKEEGFPQWDGLRQSWLDQLSRCRRTLAVADLLRLEEIEREWAEETRESLVWEAYRIAINGLSLQDLQDHLRLRQARFEQACREEFRSRRQDSESPGM